MKRLLLPLLAVTVLLSSCVSDKEKARRKLEKAKEQNNEYISQCLDDLVGEDLELKSWPRKQNCRAVDVKLIDDEELARKVRRQIWDVTGQSWTRPPLSFEEQVIEDRKKVRFNDSSYQQEKYIECLKRKSKDYCWGKLGNFE